MKKILFLILCLIGVIKVNAGTYYSTYSDFSDYSEVIVEESDTVDVEVERRYIWTCKKAVSSYYRLGENPILYYNINTNLYKDTSFSEWSKEYPKNTYIIDIESRTVYDEETNQYYIEYRYKERLYYHYRIDYYNTDDYYSNLNNCEKKEDNYMDFYSYRTRDKIEIPDNIVILSEKQELSDFIKSTSEYEIEGFINKHVNGEYLLNIKTSYISIPIKVLVNINDNIVKYYEPIIKEKEQLLTKIKNDLIKEKNNNDLLKDRLVFREGIIDGLEDKLNKNNETIISLKGILEDTSNQLFYCKNEKDSLIKSRDNYFEMYNNKLLDIKKLSNDKLLVEDKLSTCNLKVSDKEKIIIESEQEISKLNNKISSNNLVIDKFNEQVLESNMKISKLNNLVNNNENFEEKYIDVSKMLEICNINNKNLQKKLDLTKENNIKGMITWVFICCLFFMFLCLFKLLKKEFNK